MDRFHEMTVFVTVVEQGGFAAGARRLNLSASSVTRAVAGLEARLGTPLLSRTTRSLRPTEAGERFFADARQVLRELAEIEEGLVGARAAPRGTLCVTAPLMFGQMYVAPILRDYLDAYPDTDARALFADGPLDLAEEGVDVAVRIGTAGEDELHYRQVGSVRRVICGAPSLLEALGEPRTLAELDRFRLIAASMDIGNPHWMFEHEGLPMPYPLAPALAVSTAAAAIEAAVRGWGLTRLMSYQAAPQLASGELRIVLAEYEPPPMPVRVLTLPGREDAPKVGRFVDLCAERLGADPRLAWRT